MEVSQNLRGGISQERQDIYVLSYNLALFFFGSCVTGLIKVVAFHQKISKCTIKVTNLRLLVELH